MENISISSRDFAFSEAMLLDLNKVIDVVDYWDRKISDEMLRKCVSDQKRLEHQAPSKFPTVSYASGLVYGSSISDAHLTVEMVCSVDRISNIWISYPLNGSNFPVTVSKSFETDLSKKRQKGILLFMDTLCRKMVFVGDHLSIEDSTRSSP